MLIISVNLTLSQVVHSYCVCNLHNISMQRSECLLHKKDFLYGEQICIRVLIIVPRFGCFVNGNYFLINEMEKLARQIWNWFIMSVEKMLCTF